MSIFARIFLAGFVCLQLHATAILLIRTPTYIVVAADSKVVNNGGVAVRNTCKIQQTGSMFYVPIRFVRDNAAGYDLFKTIGNIEAASSQTRRRKWKLPSASH